MGAAFGKIAFFKVDETVVVDKEVQVVDTELIIERIRLHDLELSQVLSQWWNLIIKVGPLPKAMQGV